MGEVRLDDVQEMILQVSLLFLIYQFCFVSLFILSHTVKLIFVFFWFGCLWGAGDIHFWHFFLVFLSFLVFCPDVACSFVLFCFFVFMILLVLRLLRYGFTRGRIIIRCGKVP